MTAPVEVSRPGLGTRLVTFYHDVIAEMKKVTWPDRPQLQSATIQIIIFVLILGALIGLVDVTLQFALVRLPSMLFGR
jgi:preprotein translocase subunit SecE